MVKYKVKNISNKQADMVQKEIKEWMESREHITVVSVNTWVSDNKTYSTIIYRENVYYL